ncbi:MAG: WXG100 family type VII secretion target [Candidatus Methanomethylicaceae archaeon]
MERVFVDPEKLEEFATRLVTFAQDAEAIQNSIRGALQTLRETWRDQEFEKFRDAFMRCEQLFQKLIQEIRDVHPKLQADAKYIREYFGI